MTARKPMVRIGGKLRQLPSGDSLADVDALTTRVVALESAKQILLVQDRKTSGTDGGTLTVGAWRTRDLNTVIANTIPGASLSSNIITLPAGTYDVEAFATSARLGLTSSTSSAISIQTVGGTILALGSAMVVGGSGAVVSAVSVVQGRFTLAATTNIELRHYATTASTSTSGFGSAANIPGVQELYSSVKLTRVS